MAWAYERIEGYLATRKSPGHRPLMRAWNGRNHVVTPDPDEYRGLPREWKREGVIGHVARSRCPGHRALHRLRDEARDDTILTTSWDERRRLGRRGYRYMGVAGHVATSRRPGHAPLYMAFNPETHDHFYTADVGEIDGMGPSLDWEALERLLRKELGGHLERCRMYTADSEYYLPSPTVVRRIIERARLARRRYTSESFDCDDFAHLLKSAFIEDVYDSGSRSMPYAAGIVWGHEPAHAMNVVVTSDGVDRCVRIVEPQTGEIFEPGDGELKRIFLVIA